MNMSFPKTKALSQFLISTYDYNGYFHIYQDIFSYFHKLLQFYRIIGYNEEGKEVSSWNKSGWFPQLTPGRS